jgi:hypothetical protein
MSRACASPPRKGKTMIRTLSGRLTTLAGVAIAAACSAPATLVERPAARGPGWIDAGTPSLAREREVRFYADEKGAVWDDRGRKHEAAP